MKEERLKAIEILELFEDYLESKEVNIKNIEREESIKDGNKETAILFGSEYYKLEDDIFDIIKEVKK